MDFEEYEDLDEEEMKIILTLEDDSEIECSVIAIYTVEEGDFAGREYIALVIEESEDVLLYRYSEDEDGEFELIPIEDDVELNTAFDALDTLFECDCEDEECDCGR